MTAMIIETPRCLNCGRTSKLTLEVGKLTRYWAGEHVQDIWPEKPAAWREQLITGTHPKCWDAMFAPTPDLKVPPTNDEKGNE